MPNNDAHYERTIDELEVHACKWWPPELRAAEQQLSLLPTLLETQDRFISILKLANTQNPERIFDIIEAAEFPYPLFLKHLIVLTDFGSEPLQRVNKDFLDIFEGNSFEYVLDNSHYRYTFYALPVGGTLNNRKMKIDNKTDLQSLDVSPSLYKDLIMLLLFGAAATSPRVRSVLFKCALYRYLDDNDALEFFIRQNYIRVSRIIGGSTATNLGNIAQQYVVDYLKEHLGDDYNVRSNGTIPNVTQNEGVTLTTFDAVVDRKSDTNRHKKYVAIEITFQETTNSTIERKGGQARSRFEAITSSRNYIAYIIDGAGNFARRAAISVICDNSHCTVAYTQEELGVLLEFIREKIG